MTVTKRYQLRKDEANEILKKMGPELDGLRKVLVAGGVEVMEREGEKVISTGGTPVLILSGDTPIPLLSAIGLVDLKRVVVDMGAVPHVTKGADVMAPGVVSADSDIRPGAIVVVVDERHGKPLAVGLAVVPGGEMRGPKGKVVKNLHHVGDDFWSLSQKSGKGQSAKVK
jgi:PUA domain protein